VGDGKNSELKKLYVFQLANTFSEQFGWNFIFLYAFQEHFSAIQIALYFMVEFGSCALFIPLVSRLDIVKSMRWGLYLRILAFVLILKFFWWGQLYLAGMLLGGFITLFWVPYNARYLQLTKDENRAQASTLLFAMFAVSGATFPIVAGFLMQLYNFQLVLVICIVVLAAGMFATFMLPPAGEMRIDISRMLRNTKRIHGMLLCEGLWQGIFWLAVPLGLILSITRSDEYGAFYSFLGLLGGASSLVAGRWSDKVRNRRLPIMVSAVAGGIFSVGASLFLGNLPLWTAITGCVYFCIYILFPFTFTAADELSKSSADAMTVREFVTNISRVAGGAIVIVTIIITGGMAPVFAVGGAALLGLAASYAIAIKGSTQ
jgi:hypothetical protein